MDLALRPLRTEGLEWCLHDEGGLITDETAGQSWSLNPVGLFIWDHCDGRRRADQIVEAVTGAFELDNERETPDDGVLDDVHLTLTELADNGLIDLCFQQSDDPTCCNPCLPRGAGR